MSDPSKNIDPYAGLFDIWLGKKQQINHTFLASICNWVQLA